MADSRPNANQITTRYNKLISLLTVIWGKWIHEYLVFVYVFMTVYHSIHLFQLPT